MKTSKPTPGVWVHKDGTIFTMDGHIVCYQINGRYHPDYQDRIAEREANGRLLASSSIMARTLLKLLLDNADGKEFDHHTALEILRDAAPNLAADFESLTSSVGRSA